MSPSLAACSRDSMSRFACRLRPSSGQSAAFYGAFVTRAAYIIRAASRHRSQRILRQHSSQNVRKRSNSQRASGSGCPLRSAVSMRPAGCILLSNAPQRTVVLRGPGARTLFASVRLSRSAAAPSECVERDEWARFPTPLSVSTCWWMRNNFALNGVGRRYLSSALYAHIK